MYRNHLSIDILHYTVHLVDAGLHTKCRLGSSFDPRCKSVAFSNVQLEKEVISIQKELNCEEVCSPKKPQ